MAPPFLLLSRPRSCLWLALLLLGVPHFNLSFLPNLTLIFTVFFLKRPKPDLTDLGQVTAALFSHTSLGSWNVGSVTFTAVKICGRVKPPVCWACGRTAEMIQQCTDFCFINTYIDCVVILHGGNNAQTSYGWRCAVEYLPFQVSSQVARGAVGDGDHHASLCP